MRVRFLVAALRAVSRFPRVVRVCGLRLRVPRGVCLPAFAPLFEPALRDLRGARVLDIGTGCGALALLAARAGANVTATELPGVSLEVVAENARRNGLPLPTLRHGDLFDATPERYDLVIFNPPFHAGEPRSAWERSYIGEGVVRRFLAEVPHHGPSAVIAMPRAERCEYGLEGEAVASKWFPLLGRVETIRLSVYPQDAIFGASR